jgi:hypothetical protein
MGYLLFGTGQGKGFASSGQASSPGAIPGATLVKAMLDIS